MKEFQIQHNPQMNDQQKPYSTLLQPVSVTLVPHFNNQRNEIFKTSSPNQNMPLYQQKNKIKNKNTLNNSENVTIVNFIKGDLWGPFVLCLLLATTLAFRTAQSQQTIITSIFVIMWIGSMIVWLNAYFLGSNMSFFQSASLLGYCVFPLNIVSFLTFIIGGWIPPFIKLILVILSLIWSTKSAMGFIGEMVPQKKRKLALYPVTLFYLFLSWFVLII